MIDLQALLVALGILATVVVVFSTAYMRYSRTHP